MGEVHPGVPKWVALTIRDDFGIQTFVETGLLHGNTVLWAVEQFQQVISIEKFAPYIEGFRQEHKDIDVRLVHGGSGEVLLDELQELSGDLLIWLDAHYGGDLHYENPIGDSVCPVLEEIEALNSYQNGDCYILIDDARLFGKDGWPDLDAVKTALRSGERVVTVIEDVILALPANESMTMNKLKCMGEQKIPDICGAQIDLFLPAAPKDYNKIPYILEAACRHVTGLSSIHLVTPDGHKPLLDLPLPVFYYQDEELFPFDRNGFSHRSGWIYQQFLKLFQQATASWFLVLDCDLLFNQNVSLVEDGKPVFLLGNDQFHEPYFTLNKRLLGFGKTYPWSFLSACTLYCRELINRMIIHCGFETIGEFMDHVYELIDGGCYPAESELYGSFVYRMYPDLYTFRNLVDSLHGKYNEELWLDNEIENLQREMSGKPEVDIFTIHTWL